MKEDEFPAFFRAADNLSKGAQNHFLFALGFNLTLLVVAAIVSLINCAHWGAAVLQAVLLGTTLAASVYLAAYRPERIWYAGRAVAESIKTLSWRYVTRVEPFLESDEVSRQEFIKRLDAVISQNKIVSDKFSMSASEAQITKLMSKIRSASPQERLDYYIKNRINDQLDWYTRKAGRNRESSRILFGLIILANFLAFVSALLKIKFIEFQFYPTDVLITAAGGLLAWMQVKRYSELAASYALTANEISILREQAPTVITDKSLSDYIGDAENAFSREHTQWVARKDN